MFVQSVCCIQNSSVKKFNTKTLLKHFTVNIKFQMMNFKAKDVISIFTLMKLIYLRCINWPLEFHDVQTVMEFPIVSMVDKPKRLSCTWH